MENIRVKSKLKLPIDKNKIKHAAQITLGKENIPIDSDMGIVIADDELLRILNLKYRHIDATTDVLSFPVNELDPDTNMRYLGDVIISLPQAEVQASAGGHPLSDELQLLVVHGTLHLLGHDHDEPAEKQKMQTAQDDILAQLGVSLMSRL